MSVDPEADYGTGRREQEFESGGYEAEDVGAPEVSSADVRADAMDQHIGARIRERRLALGLSQQQLGGRTGVTCQQAYKYETGRNRISGGRLYLIARALDVDTSWFFEGFGDAVRAPQNRRQRLSLEMTRSFNAIDNEKYQEALTQMARALAAAEPWPLAS